MIKFAKLICAIIMVMGGSYSAFSQKKPIIMVLLPGSGGIHDRDFLVRNVPKFQAAGLTTALTTSPSEAVSLVSSYKAQGARVVLVGMSYGTGQAGTVIASGAAPDRLVLVSGDLMGAGMRSGSVAGNIGSASLLPPTLVVHHRNDGCRRSPPQAVSAFQSWGQGKVRVAWISGGGGDGDPCMLNSAHGFKGKNDAAAAAIINFAVGR